MKIAIVKLSSLGDIVHSMVVLQFIKKHYPDIVIDWVVEKRFKGALENNPQINQIHHVSFSSATESKSIYLLLKELRKIRKLDNYDLVIDMQGLIKSALVARIIPSDITVGFDKNSLRESLAAIFYNQTYKINYAENVIERNSSLVSYALEIPFNHEDLKFKESFLFSDQKYSFTDFSNTKQNIALIPGASYPSKCYPVEKLAELTTKLDANFLIIWGNEKEKMMADEIKALSNKVSVCEKLSLVKLISLISQVDLVIGPDTGPTHMAWALNIPSITLFGPTPGYRNTFSTNINKSIESKSKVNPYKINKNDYSINEISVKKLNNLANELLRKSL